MFCPNPTLAEVTSEESSDCYPYCGGTQGGIYDGIGGIIAGILTGIIACCIFFVFVKVQPECEAERDVESHAYPQALLDQQRRQSLQIAPISAVVVVPLQQRTNWAGVARNQQATHLQPDDNSYVQTDDL